MSKLKHTLALFLILILTFSGSASAYSVPDLSKNGSITVVMAYGEETVVPGGTMSIYQVGSLQEEDQEYSLTPNQEFAGSELELDDLESAELAKALDDYADQNNIPCETKDIDENGRVVFSDLTPGLYLLVQEESNAEYECVAPFLALIPTKDDGEYLYDITAKPKEEPVPVVDPWYEEEPEEPGDSSEPSDSSEPGDSSEPEPENPSTPSNNKPGDKTTSTTKTTTTTTKTTTQPTTLSTTSKNTDTKLPQTGQLTWPIPILAIAGMVLVIAGWVIRRREK
jgi:LPXTG-motif cell wall-anchored protein